ncbi:response regulator [Flavitalea sp.]|nr:response regulator [Flavitalea sp.]
MTSHPPIVIVDDDLDDLDLIKEAHEELKVPHPLILLKSGAALINYLQESSANPFIIISDFNLPIINGLELRKKILEDTSTRYKSIPYIIWSTGANSVQVKRSYDTFVQGFFLKPPTFEELKTTYSAILRYWELSLQPKF